MISPHLEEENVAAASVCSVFGTLMREALFDVISMIRLR